MEVYSQAFHFIPWCVSQENIPFSRDTINSHPLAKFHSSAARWRINERQEISSFSRELHQFNDKLLILFINYHLWRCFRCAAPNWSCRCTINACKHTELLTFISILKNFHSKRSKTTYSESIEWIKSSSLLSQLDLLTKDETHHCESKKKRNQVNVRENLFLQIRINFCVSTQKTHSFQIESSMINCPFFLCLMCVRAEKMEKSVIFYFFLANRIMRCSNRSVLFKRIKWMIAFYVVPKLVHHFEQTANRTLLNYLQHNTHESKRDRLLK